MPKLLPSLLPLSSTRRRHWPPTAKPKLTPPPPPPPPPLLLLLLLPLLQPLPPHPQPQAQASPHSWFTPCKCLSRPAHPHVFAVTSPSFPTHRTRNEANWRENLARDVADVLVHEDGTVPTEQVVCVRACVRACACARVCLYV